METIVLTGEVDPLSALDLRTRLAAAITGLRPIVTVDMTAVVSIHVAAAAAIIDATRSARVRGGDVYVTPPASERARRELALVSLVPADRCGSR